MAAPHRSAVRALLLMVGQHTVGRGAEWHTSRPRMGATAEKVSRIIGSALAYEIDDGTLQTGSAFLSARLHVMAKDGRLEIMGGSALEMHLSQVRLPEA